MGQSGAGTDANAAQTKQQKKPLKRYNFFIEPVRQIARAFARCLGKNRVYPWGPFMERSRLFAAAKAP
jgi:hypothetical protein